MIDTREKKELGDCKIMYTTSRMKKETAEVNLFYLLDSICINTFVVRHTVKSELWYLFLSRHQIVLDKSG